MTPEQATLVQDSFRLVVPIKGQAAALFYGRLFAIDPSTAPLFIAPSRPTRSASSM